MPGASRSKLVSPTRFRAAWFTSGCKNRFYFDELYNLVLIRPTLWLAQWTYTFIDKTVIDGILHWRGAQRRPHRRGVSRVRPRGHQRRRGRVG